MGSGIMKTTALLAVGVDRVELVETRIPDPGPGQVVVEALLTAVSPGTEMRCLAGKQPGTAFPFIPGYSMVGRIAARGEGVSLAEGTHVFCSGTEKADLPLLWGAHIAHALHRPEDVFVLPEGVEPIDASLAKLAAIAYRGVRLADTRPHNEVAVVGLGIIGQLSARLHALCGARVVAADIDAHRVNIAKAAGIEAMVPLQGLAASFRTLQGQGADVVVDSTGVSSLLQEAVLLAKMKPWDNSITEPARLVVQGSYAANVIFDYHQAFFRELSVLFPRDCQKRDIQAMLALLASGRLKTRDLISRVVRPADAQATYLALRAGESGLLTTVFQWQ
jgi:2-desacetyl-2-hydroxyethyl bacteriochlorophyllide A dehydrogenase